jgi:hypothetical protein
MKAFNIIIILSIISNISLYPMNIVSKKSHLSSFQKKIFSPAFKKKALQFCKITNIDNIAIASNIVATCSTGNPLCLLQSFPHVMHRTAGYMQEQKTPSTEFDQDLKQLLHHEPSIIKHLQTIEEIDQKINSFKDFKCTEISKHYDNEIFNLEEKKKEIILTIINKSKPLFQNYNNMNISAYIKNKTLNLELDKKTFSWKKRGDLQFNFTLMLTAINLFHALMSSSIPGSITIGFGTILALARVETADGIQKELEEMSQRLENTIKILKIYQTHMNTKEDRSTQPKKVRAHQTNE